jgi:hypothetical protein
MTQSREDNMKRTRNLIAAAVALTTLVGTSAFAESRRQDGTSRDGSNRGSVDSDRRNDSNRSYRDNDRVTIQGRVSNFARERDGYRVYLDRGGDSYWVPSSRLGGRNLSVGINVSLGGVFRGGMIYVDDLGWPDRGYSDVVQDHTVRGVVDRVDDRRGILEVRDESSGRRVTVDMVRADRRGRVGLDGLRRGDYVTISGGWSRGGIFEAYRVDNVRSARR